eukprot:4872868-Prymnesium_polylepis.1
MARMRTRVRRRGAAWSGRARACGGVERARWGAHLALRKVLSVESGAQDDLALLAGVPHARAGLDTGLAGATTRVEHLTKGRGTRR